MQAIIVAGGQGTRLRPLTYDFPKPVVPIFNRPFLYHQIDWLRRHGIDDIILTLHYRGEVIERELGDGRQWGVRLRYVYETEPLGTAGAVGLARPLLGRDPVLVMNGDVLTDLDLGQFLAFHRQQGAVVSIGLTRVSDPTAYGLVFVDDGGRVSRFLEKPSADEAVVDTINAGLYWLDPAVLEMVPVQGAYSFERGLFPALLEQGALIGGYHGRAYWLDIGTPAKYFQAHQDVLAGRLKLTIPDVEQVDDDVWVARGAQIDRSASLLGPVFIGENARIGRQARLNPFVILGEGVQIGDGCWLEETLIWSGSTIGPGCRLKGAVLANDCRVDADSQLGSGIVLGPGSHLTRGSQLNHLR